MNNLILITAFLFSSIAIAQATLKKSNRALDQDFSLCVNDGGVEKCPLNIDGDTSEVNMTDTLSVKRIQTLVNSSFAATGTPATVFTLSADHGSTYLISVSRISGASTKGLYLVTRDTAAYSIAEIVDSVPNLTASTTGEEFKLAYGSGSTNLTVVALRLY